MTKLHTIRMSTRGRITIPAAVRKSLDLKGGEKARWSFKANGDVEACFEPVSDHS